MFGGSLDLLAAPAHLGEHDVQALLVDEPQARRRKAHLHPAVLALDPELAVLKVREVTTLGLVVRVGHVVSDSGGLPRHLAHSGHGKPLLTGSRIKALDFSTALDFPATEHTHAAMTPILRTTRHLLVLSIGCAALA